MFDVPNAPISPRLDVSPSRRGRRGKVLAGLILALAAAGAVGYEEWAGKLGLRRYIESPRARLETLEVDRGEMVTTVTESGVLESSDNAAVKCRVEALVALSGAPGGVAGGGMRPNPAPGSGPDVSNRAAAKLRATTTTVVAVSAPAPTPAPAPAAAAAAVGVRVPKPQVKSFTSPVSIYSPMRALNGSPVGQRASGSTRILKILDEGARVKEGDVLCELDSANLREEVRIQTIRCLEAKAALDQVKSTLEVTEIALREYRDAIYPQDLAAVRQYVESCRTERERARKNLDWSEDAHTKGLRAANQVKADALTLQQMDFQFRDAEHTADRLEKFTAPRVIAKLEARIEAIRSDLFAEEAAFRLENQRLKRLERAVANCTLRAPRDGIVVYHKSSNSWGRVETRIQEGMVVREGQTIIDLPDPRHLRVRARINESKIALVKVGMETRIAIDAYPGEVFTGRVEEITAIPTTANGPSSDVKVYNAVISLDSPGDDQFRPGLSAEVTFLVDAGRPVTRLPLPAIRWVDGRAFAAVVHDPDADPEADRDRPELWEWRPLSIGQTDHDYAEILSGLAPGEHVVAAPEQLPAPRPGKRTRTL